MQLTMIQRSMWQVATEVSQANPQLQSQVGEESWQKK